MVKNLLANSGDIRNADLIPWLGGSPGVAHPFQYSYLENPVDRGAWWANSPQGFKESDTTESTWHIWHTQHTVFFLLISNLIVL